MKRSSASAKPRPPWWHALVSLDGQLPLISVLFTAKLSKARIQQIVSGDRLSKDQFLAHGRNSKLEQEKKSWGVRILV